MSKTEIILSFRKGEFSLDVSSGTNLWSGKYDNFTQAIEFARSFCSNLTQTTLTLEDGLKEKYDSSKKKREQAFIKGTPLNLEE